MQSDYDLKGITYATEVKFLGLTLDNTLSWKRHIEQVVSKMCSVCYALRNIKAVVTRDTLRIIYFATIHSSFAPFTRTRQPLGFGVSLRSAALERAPERSASA
jgi:hypothetical protein